MDLSRTEDTPPPPGNGDDAPPAASAADPSSSSPAAVVAELERRRRRRLRLLRERRRQLSQRVCARCGEGFSLLFNRRLECPECELGVCRRCAVWRPEEEAWQCTACKEER